MPAIADQEIQDITREPKAERFNSTMLRWSRYTYMGSNKLGLSPQLSGSSLSFKGAWEHQVDPKPYDFRVWDMPDSRAYVWQVCDQVERMPQHAHDIARIHLPADAKQNKQMYDVKIKKIHFKVGDLMWLETDMGK